MTPSKDFKDNNLYYLTLHNAIQGFFFIVLLLDLKIMCKCHLDK